MRYISGKKPQIGFDDEEGKPHWLSVIDWEFFQLWRKERDRLGNIEQAAEQVRKKLERPRSMNNFGTSIRGPACGE